MSLPGFVSFYINQNGQNSYLGHSKSTSGVNNLQYNANESATSQNTRFAVESAQKGDGLVHLRHCFLNKYLIPVGVWASPSASEIEEDEEKGSQCTLFRPENVNGKVRLVHVATETPIQVTTSGVVYWMFSNNSSEIVPCETEFFDLESLLVFPKRVVFKGDNDKYLGYYEETEYPGPIVHRLRFMYTDIADPRAQFEVSYHRDGQTLIKCVYHDKLCKYISLIDEQGYISPDAPDANDVFSWFKVVEGPEGTFAICSDLVQSGTIFFGRDNGNKDYLRDVAKSLIPAVQLRVEEAVISRIIYVDYRLDSFRIFDAKPLIAASSTVANHSNVAHQTQLDVSYSKSKTFSWSSSIGYTFGVRTSVSASVPFISQASIEVSHEIAISGEMGESKTEEETVSNTQVINLPAMSIATVTVMAFRGQCDIPFNYRQVDTLYDGRRVQTVLHDGVYRNVNNYDFHTVIHITDMDSPQTRNSWSLMDAYTKAIQISRAEHESVPKYQESSIDSSRAKKLLL